MNSAMMTIAEQSKTPEASPYQSLRTTSSMSGKCSKGHEGDHRGDQEVDHRVDDGVDRAMSQGGGEVCQVEVTPCDPGPDPPPGGFEQAVQVGVSVMVQSARGQPPPRQTPTRRVGGKRVGRRQWVLGVQVVECLRLGLDPESDAGKDEVASFAQMFVGRVAGDSDYVGWVLKQATRLGKNRKYDRRAKCGTLWKIVKERQ